MSNDRVVTNGVELAYETFGERGRPPILLVMGLGTQMIGWPDGMCEQLAERGYFVVRFDNRDIGKSSYLDGVAAPSAVSIALRRRRPAYTRSDFSDDTIGLIGALELGPVHLVGASMGGFIAQTVAIARPDLVRSLTLIMTSTGARWVGYPAARVLAAVLRAKPAPDRAAAIAASVATHDLIGSPGYGSAPEYVNALAELSYERGYNPIGAQRQLGAVAGQTNRTRALGKLTMPTVVLHGLADPLVHCSGGLALARAISGARFVGYPGMGHDLPEELWPDFVDEIVRGAGRAAHEGAGRAAVPST